MLRYLLLAGALAVSLGSARAQRSYNLPPQQHYPTAVVGLKTQGRVSVADLHVVGDSIRFAVGAPRAVRAVHLDEVAYVRVRSGSNVGAGIGIGAAVGLAVALPLALDEEPDIRRRAGPVIALATGIGAGVGALVGALTPRRRSYYVHARG